MQNFKTLAQPILGEKYVAQKEEKKKKRKIIPNIVDTSFRTNAQGQRTHSARTNKLVYNETKFGLESFFLSRRNDSLMIWSDVLKFEKQSIPSLEIF